MENINNLVEAYLNTLGNISEEIKNFVNNAYIAGYNQRNIDDIFDNDIQDDGGDIFADNIDEITPMNLDE